MISQVFIIALGLFLIGKGLVVPDYLNIALGVLIVAFASSTLYRLKVGK